MSRPWMDRSLGVEARIEALVSQMTLEECAQQTNQIPVNRATEDDLRAGLGSIILAGSATAGNDDQDATSAGVCNARQRVAVEESRLGIPVIFGRDVIHGHHTVFPIPVGQGASWDPELVEAGCRAAAVEASSDGVHWTFSPMLDICRDPRWGRMAEGYGESSYLTGVLGAAAVRGYQGDDLAAPTAIAACAKHFAGYGASEGGRDYNGTEITWPTLQDVHLQPFKAAVAAGCQTLMTSFNEIGGVPSCANGAILTDILRDTWCFDGFVVTDWKAVRELIGHGLAANEADATVLALEAGADMDMLGLCYVRSVVKLVEDGRLKESVVRRAVARILRVKFRLGLFENPYTAPGTVDRSPHRALARRAASRCAVLLANDGILPLKPVTRVAVVGPLAHARRELFGTWTLDGVESEVVSLVDAMRERLGGAMKVTDTPWHDISMVQHQVKQADVAVVVMGETPSASGEANSVADPGLPLGQRETLERLVQLGTPIVLVVLAGRSLVLPDAVERCAAVLFSFHPGTDGAHGLVDVLLGEKEPGGRLPVTMLRHPGQIPLYHDHKPTGRSLAEYSRPIGEKGDGYRLLDCLGRPRYPFGFGLGYTRFELGKAGVDGVPSREQGVRIKVLVRNAGARDGATVVQVYLGDPVAELSQPVRRLVAFQRVELAAGEERVIKIDVEPEQLCYTHRDGTRRSDPGDVVLQVGQHRNDGETLRVVV